MCSNNTMPFCSVTAPYINLIWLLLCWTNFQLILYQDASFEFPTYLWEYALSMKRVIQRITAKISQERWRWIWRTCGALVHMMIISFLISPLNSPENVWWNLSHFHFQFITLDYSHQGRSSLPCSSPPKEKTSDSLLNRMMFCLFKLKLCAVHEVLLTCCVC